MITRISKKKDIFVIGAGGLGREIMWLIEEINIACGESWNIKGFIDSDKGKHGKILNGYNILGDGGCLNQIDKETFVVVAIGESFNKIKEINKLNNEYLKFATLIHPDTIFSRFSEIGEGSIITKDCIITVNIKIGKHVLLNLDCTVGHDVIIGDYSSIQPGANISGNVSIGEGVYIGTGAQIIQGITVGNYSIIGAGAVVTKDIPPYCVAVGVPAKVIRKNENKS